MLKNDCSANMTPLHQRQQQQQTPIWQQSEFPMMFNSPSFVFSPQEPPTPAPVIIFFFSVKFCVFYFLFQKIATTSF
jgi:hypothetical protein